jgi:hypothetical protein
MECALVEIDLPKVLYANPNKNKWSPFFLDMVFHWNIEPFVLENHTPNQLNLVHDIKTYSVIMPKGLKKRSYINNFKANGQQIYDEICKTVEKDMNEMLIERCKDLFPTSILSSGELADGVDLDPLKCQIIEMPDGKTKLSTRVGTLSIKKAKPNLLDEKLDIAKYWFTFGKELSDLLELDIYPLLNTNYLINIANKDVFFEKIIGTKLSSNDKIYIYTDIIKESFIDNNRTNILRYLPYQLNKSYYSFKHQLFIPLGVEEFNSITVSIRNSEKKLLSFNEGSLCVALKLRPIEYI